MAKAPSTGVENSRRCRCELSRIRFYSLQDWSTHPEPGIKYYSGIATYRKSFNLTRVPTGKTFLNLGVVHDMAQVKLKGKDLGVIWCAPWRVEVTRAIKAGNNQLEIEVVNRWPNCLIGDKQPGKSEVRPVDCPPGFLGGRPIIAGRYTFCTSDPYKQDSALLPSGLLGPVALQVED
jgi:hypothetical protein